MLTVTVRDSETGEEQTRDLPDDDYIVITTGTCRYGVQAYANGTHVVTIKGRKAGFGRARQNGEQR